MRNPLSLSISSLSSFSNNDNMHTSGVIDAFICINNHVNSSMNCMLSATHFGEELRDSFVNHDNNKVEIA